MKQKKTVLCRHQKKRLTHTNTNLRKLERLEFPNVVDGPQGLPVVRGPLEPPRPITPGKEQAREGPRERRLRRTEVGLGGGGGEGARRYAASRKEQPEHAPS